MRVSWCQHLCLTQDVKEKKAQEDFEKKKEKGLLHVSGDVLQALQADEEKQKAKRKAGCSTCVQRDGCVWWVQNTIPIPITGRVREP